MTNNTFYHDGELTVQERCHVSEMAMKITAAFRDQLPDSAIAYIAEQPFCVIGSADESGQIWASLHIGKPGFLQVESPQQLLLSVESTHSLTTDIFFQNIRKNPNVGMLVIDFSTRRRLRINGYIRQASTGQYAIGVQRVYGNCPKYIQRRHWKTRDDSISTSDAQLTTGQQLNLSQRNVIEKADTFFVASAHPQQGLDASHRGGYPGFVKFVSDNQIRIPDYQGNSMFNTLGNFMSYAHAGLIFIDFDSGDLLQLSGIPQILFDEADNDGAERHWLLTINAWRQYSPAVSMDWIFDDYSPFIQKK